MSDETTNGETVPPDVSVEFPPDLFRYTEGPWIFAKFVKRDGNPIETVQDVKDALCGSVDHSERAELWGVTTDEAERTTVICYTGNGPTSESNARCLSAFPEIIKGYERAIDQRDALLAACRAAKDALRSYQYGNSSSDLAKDVADFIDLAIAKTTQGGS